jgi:DNA-binding Lrp family transcriptional regulator
MRQSCCAVADQAHRWLTERAKLCKYQKMVSEKALVVDDLRLIAALQCDGRLMPEHAARVLGLNPRVVQRRLRALLRDGLVRVVAVRPRPRVGGVMLLRIRVLRGKLDAVTAALAARDDIPFVDVSATGDEISAVLLAGPDPGNRLVFRQLPATSAVTSVEAQTAMHVFSDATDWRLDVLTEAERAAFQPGVEAPTDREPDDTDRDILALLAQDARMSAAAVADRTEHPESTVRRRLTALRRERHFVTHVVIDPARLGLDVDANLWMRVPPALLDEAGRQLARHPAVHGALATTGAFNLHAAVWLRDLEHLYQFVTQDIAALGITDVETVLVGRAVKRPGG